MNLPVVSISMPSMLVGQQNGIVDPSLLSPIQGGRLLHPAARAWNAMVHTALIDGVVLEPSAEDNTYRGYGIQWNYFSERNDHTPRNTKKSYYLGLEWWQIPGKTTAAVPGTSNHSWGLAVDVDDVERGGRFSWLCNNGPRFGFSLEAGIENTEHWHWHYFAGDAIPPGLIPNIEEDDMWSPEAQAAAMGGEAAGCKVIDGVVHLRLFDHFENESPEQPAGTGAAVYGWFPMAAALIYIHQNGKYISRRLKA